MLYRTKWKSPTIWPCEGVIINMAPVQSFPPQVFVSWYIEPVDMGFSGGASGKEFACQWRRRKRARLSPWVRKIPWRRAWQPAAIFLPGESHGQRSLAGSSPRGGRETWLERLSTYMHTYCRYGWHAVLRLTKWYTFSHPSEGLYTMTEVATFNTYVSFWIIMYLRYCVI